VIIKIILTFLTELSSGFWSDWLQTEKCGDRRRVSLTKNVGNFPYLEIEIDLETLILKARRD
jgi:hypothetical protein